MSFTIKETRNCELIAELNHDVQEIHAQIEPQIFKKYSKENMKMVFQDALKNESVKFFVGYSEDEPAGYIMVSKRDYPETQFKYAYSVIYIEQICVDSRFLHRGIGKQLIDKVKVISKELGITRIEIDYWNNNSNAGEFFKSQGFSAFNQKLFYER